MATQGRPGPCLRVRVVYGKLEGGGLCSLQPWDPGRHSPYLLWPSPCLPVAQSLSSCEVGGIPLCPAGEFASKKTVGQWDQGMAQARDRWALAQCHYPNADLIVGGPSSPAGCLLSPAPIRLSPSGLRLSFRVPLCMATVSQHPSSESFPRYRFIVGTTGGKASRSSVGPASTKGRKVGGRS